MGIRYDEKLNIVPLMILEMSGAGIASNYVKVSNAQWATFLVCIGDADTAITVTLESSSANSSNASEAQVGFKYRLSGAASAGSDTYTAITWASGDVGYVFVKATDTGKLLICDVDPSSLTDGHNYMRVVATCTSINEATMVATSMVAVLEPRYPQKEHLSST